MNVATDQFEAAAPLDRLLAASAGAAMVGGAAAVWYFDPRTAGFFPVCPLYSLTGYACPGCGLTRGFHALFHGDVLTALDYNAMLPFFGLLLSFGFVSLGYFAIFGKRFPLNLLNSKFLYAFLVLLLIFGITRNLPWYPFNVLFP